MVEKCFGWVLMFKLGKDQKESIKTLYLVWLLAKQKCSDKGNCLALGFVSFLEELNNLPKLLVVGFLNSRSS